MIKDIAISGNGEPTSLKGFERAIELIGQIAMEMGVFPESNFVLITNGSLMHQTDVQAGLKVLNSYRGEVWFKLDSATEQGRKKINDNKQSTEKTVANLKLASVLCETSLQTCMLDFLSTEEAEQERQAYLKFLKNNKEKLSKIMLYSLARPSLQPEAKQLNKLEEQQMQHFAEEIRQLGYRVTVS